MYRIGKNFFYRWRGDVGKFCSQRLYVTASTKLIFRGLIAISKSSCILQLYFMSFLLLVWLYRVSRYGGKCDWLKDDQFIRDLEGDSVDAEILDEELRLLEEQQPRTYVQSHLISSQLLTSIIVIIFCFSSSSSWQDSRMCRR